MNNAHFLTKQYLKLLQTMVYMSTNGLSTRPVQHLIRSNVEERKIISEMITFYELEGVKKYGLKKQSEKLADPYKGIPIQSNV
ncbi:hypothetical protein LCGC14_2366520 [marine sediment metagenome]|uniref:Uncharacterized protein n=1 Tax=marine sediment metagenome TaxID=412755 RepID=A0A0F9EHJ6_9ZZZZ